MIVRNSVGEIGLSLKSEKNIMYFTWRQIHLFDHISLSSS